jgi:hypothetical protein
MSIQLIPKAEKFRKQMLNGFLFDIFLLMKLPLAWMAGCRLKRIDTEGCVVQLPYGWRSQNPFNSIYFAAQSMAAEMSTGVPALFAIENSEHSIAMLVAHMEADFTKKADKLTTFTCDDVPKMFAAIEETCRTGEAVLVPMETVGRMADGTEVARFTFTWSVKRRGK